MDRIPDEDEGGRRPDRSGGGREASGGAGEGTAAPSTPSTPSSLLRHVTDLFARAADGLSPSSCSGCLSQVDDEAADGGGDDRAEGQGQDRGRDAGRDQGQDAARPAAVITGGPGGGLSLLDRDAAPSRDGSRLDPGPSADSADVSASVGIDASSLGDPGAGEVEATDATDADDAARRSDESDAGADADEGLEVSTDQSCPICLLNMSPSDVTNPVQCPTACGYNFCLRCTTSLLRSSREDYQEASDGSRRVKVRLACPHCRADLSGTIEGCIEARRRAEADAERGAERALAAADRRSIERCAARKAPPRLFNRSSAPRRVHRKKIRDLIESVESMQPTYRVLAASGERRGGTGDAAALNDSTSSYASSTSSSSVDVVVRLPSSYKGSPAHATEASPSSLRRSHSVALCRAKGNDGAIEPPISLRRTKSLQVASKKASPRSVFDWTSPFGGPSDDGRVLGSEEAQSKKVPPSPRAKGNGTKGSKVCLEGIDFADGDGGFFSSAIDLGWCCYDNTTKGDVDGGGGGGGGGPGGTPSINIEGCGGYVDYSGIYHPCTNVKKDGTGQVIEWDGPCQGCVFRRGKYDGGNGNGSQEEEPYYDSDPGQHFAIGSWTCPKMHRVDHDDAEGESSRLQLSASSAGADSTNVRQRAKLRWRRRMSRRSKSSRKKASSGRIDGSNADDVPTTLGGPEGKTQEDQQAYLYDYFSRNNAAAADAMNTGICSTNNSDIGKHVQEGLNSKWRLQWHVNITRSREGGKQGHLPPRMCEVWIERGYRRNRTEIVEPKLMWRELSQPNLHDKRQLGGSTIRPYRVSLFAVRRIFQVGTGGRAEKIHVGGHPHKREASLPPMSKPDCLILVRSSLGEDYIFEASCPEERDHIAHLWKMATARLVSHAVVGNGDLMIEEFFHECFVAGGVYSPLLSAKNDDE
ncbi:hypothetical protein ACHAWF_018630 [Thalassiosira exigua]